MALSTGFRRAMKNRTRRSRRIEVLLFFVVMAMGLSCAGLPFRWATFGERTFPFIFAAGRIFRLWQWQRLIKVQSLDDRAMLEFGVEFEKLEKAQQHDVIRRYRVGTYYVNYFPDELQISLEAQAQVRAYGLMRHWLPPLVVVYWLGWFLLPEGSLRAGWTDAPTVLAWMALLILALPQMVQMWTEPNEPEVEIEPLRERMAQVKAEKIR